MTRIVAVDYDSGKALFASTDDVGVIVDINNRDVESKCSLSNALTASTWNRVAADLEYPSVWRELADAAVTKLDVDEKKDDPGERHFRVPASVRAEAQCGLDWALGFERGQTPVSMATAKMLTHDNYIPREKIERMARYFNRRPKSIMENSGWTDGTQGFPTDERIKYAMWGGEAAREWVAKITKKHPVIAAASLYEDTGIDGNKPHQFVLDPEAADDSGIGECIICGRDPGHELHTAVIASAFEINPDVDYFGKGVDPDSTQVTELYLLDVDDSWSMYDGTGFVAIDEPDENMILIMLDPESAKALAEFIEQRDPENQDEALELTTLNPTEAALFFAAEAEVDWELVDRVFDIYDSQERSVNAKKQVRGPGGKFGDQPDSPDSKKADPQATTKARLPQALPLVTDAQARISAYLEEVKRQRSTSSAPLEDGFEEEGGPATASTQDQLSEEYRTNLLEMYGDTVLGQQELDAEFNWVEDVGGLPKYIKRIEKHLREKGMTEGHAIATAINVAKKMCATGDVNFPGVQHVNPKSQAEACAAVAEWEEKKARAHENSTAGTEFAQAGPGDVTDVRPLYLAIVDKVDTEAVLDLVSLVPPAAGAEGDIVAWKRDKGTWVAADEILGQLRSVSPPPVVELTDDAILGSVIEQVDKATAEDEPQPDPAPAPTTPEAPKPDANPDQHPIIADSAKRDKLAKRGYALPDGSFPIENVSDLKNAIQAYGRAKNQNAARVHIMKRARALNRADLIPKDWDKNERDNSYSIWGPYGEIVNLSASDADSIPTNADRLKQYMTRGEGSTRVRWGEPGDYGRCVSQISKYIGLKRSKGYAALLHFDATGTWPGEEDKK